MQSRCHKSCFNMNFSRETAQQFWSLQVQFAHEQEKIIFDVNNYFSVIEAEYMKLFTPWLNQLVLTALYWKQPVNLVRWQRKVVWASLFILTFCFFFTLTFCLVSVHILNHCKNMAVLLSIDDLMVIESILFHYPFQLWWTMWKVFLPGVRGA